MSTCLFIFRRDLRTVDNTTLLKIHNKYDKIIPVFIFTPQQVKKNKYKSSRSIQFMIESLKEIPNLITFYGDNIKVLKEIIKKIKIDCIAFNKDYTPFSIDRDFDIKKFCKDKKINFESYDDVCLLKPGTIRTDSSGTIYKKFTPFFDKCMENKDKIIKFNKKNIKFKKFTQKLPNQMSLEDAYLLFTKQESKLLKGGRKEGLKLKKKIKNFKNYNSTRDDLSQNTTRLSSYLKFGCLSIREVYQEVKDKLGFKNDLIKQLFWRDFYINLTFGYPRVLKGKSLKEKYDDIKWKNSNKLFKAWKKGQTGFPIVDAAMTELNKTGYMHNRGRLIVSSFLIKILQIDWRHGEKYFARKLIDYDPAVNNGNWQWSSGSGADSQPYFRIFNPWSQSKKHDTNCQYIKKWLPNLKPIKNEDIHIWNKKYKKYNLGMLEYLKPIVDYSKERKKTLKLYKKYV